MAEEITIGQALLAEYNQLKSEQQQRIRFRDSLVYTTLAAMAAVVAAALQGHSNLVFLLLPPVTFTLAWKYIAADDKITAIGRYVHSNLAPRLSAVVCQPVFYWETVHGRHARRWARKTMQIVADLMVFCIAPAAALITVWLTTTCPPALLVVSIVDALLVIVTGVFVVNHAEVDPRPTMLPQAS